MRERPTKLLWKTPANLSRGLQRSSNTLLIELLHSFICVDPQSGEKLFEMKPESWTSYQALLQQNELLVLRQKDSEETLLEGFSPTTGEQRWCVSLKGSAYQVAANDDLFASPSRGVLYVYQLLRQGSPRLQPLHELALPALKYGSFHRAFIDESKRLVGVSSDSRSLVWSLHDGALLWDSEHQLQMITPWGWFAQRAHKYEVDLFDPFGSLLQTLLDPRCAANNPHVHSTNGRGYQVLQANERHIALASKYFSRSSGFGADKLFVLRRGESTPSKLSNSSRPCVFLEDELIYVGGYGELRLLDYQHQPLWEISSDDWQAFGLEKTIVSHLLPQQELLYGLSFDEAFCLA